uniref:Homeobox domain-containing protein n=1 Tax=Catagonus wagneri TaxID=51154 RepID=A0A8C3W6Y2_9CETA
STAPRRGTPIQPFFWAAASHFLFFFFSSTDLAAQKPPALPCDPIPEQSHSHHPEVERRGKKRWREGEKGEKKEVIEENVEKEQEKEEEEKEELHDKNRLASRPLLDTLWATFKLIRFPTRGVISSLAFEFSMTEAQINQWFCQKRKLYKREIYKRQKRSPCSKGLTVFPV